MMRTEIDFLPHRKQRELDIIVEILFQGLRAATENAVGARRNGRILKVILFGSYARGDWVEAPQDANQYRSDYDIRSEEHTSDLQSLMRTSYAVFCLKKKTPQ